MMTEEKHHGKNRVIAFDLVNAFDSGRRKTLPFFFFFFNEFRNLRKDRETCERQMSQFVFCKRLLILIWLHALNRYLVLLYITLVILIRTLDSMLRDSCHLMY